jgi:lipoprotein NlpI
MRQGRYELALADYKYALELSPAEFFAPFNVGHAAWAMGQNDLAISSFGKSLEMDPSSAYAALWRAIARGPSDRTTQELKDAATGFALDKWPGPVVRFYLGTATQEDVFAAALNGNAGEKAGQTCEADFYVGERQLQLNGKEVAKPLLERARDGCPHEFIEFDSAVAELRHLQ